MASKILAPHRVIGVVGDGATPFALQSLGGEPFVTVSVGYAFQVFSVEHLRVVAVSQRMPRRITALVAGGRDRTFVACGRTIDVWERMHRLAALGSHPGQVVSMLVLGEVLVSVCDRGCLRVWDIKPSAANPRLKGHKHLGEERSAGGDPVFEIASLGAGFEKPTCCLHPDTYLNKVLVGSRSGALALFNIRTGKRIHTFAACGGGAAAVTVLQQSPALDVVAVGFADGTIALLHLKQDVRLFQFRAAAAAGENSSGGVAVTSLSFRTDGGFAHGGGGQPPPTLASGMADGRVWVWNLETRSLAGEVNAPLGAHDGGAVLSAVFLPKEPVLLSLGQDNALKAWIFDQTGGQSVEVGGSSAGCRLLRSREGHAAPPRTVAWYKGGGSGGGGQPLVATAGHGDDATALQLLSGGDDRSLRSFHAVRDGLSRELSQGRFLAKARRLCVRPTELKLRPVVAVASCEARARDWCDVVTAHADDSCAYVWHYENRALGPHELRQPHWPVSNMGQDQDPQHYATAVAISVCGNYALVGTRGGVVYKYNLQSGLPRGAYPAGAQRRKQNSRKLEAGSVRLTAKRMKKALAGPQGHLRNAAGQFVRGKHGVGFATAEEQKTFLEPTFGGGIDDGSGHDGDGGGVDDDDDDEFLERDDDVVDAVVVSSSATSANAAVLAAEEAVDAAAAAEDELRWCRSAEAKHSEAVTGLAVDALNQLVLTASLDGTLRWWTFTTGALAVTRSYQYGSGGQSEGGSWRKAHRSSAIVAVGSPVAMMELARDSGLVACGCDDAVVRIFDVESRRLVRRLKPPLPRPSSGMPKKAAAAAAAAAAAPPLTDIAFAPDAGRLYATARDGTLRVWDLPTSKCVDWVAFSRAAARAHRKKKPVPLPDGDEEEEEQDIDDDDDDDDDSDDEEDDAVGLGPATSVCVSPNGEFICTSHAGELGLHLWTDRTLYENVAMLDREPRRPALLHAPVIMQEHAKKKKKKSKSYDDDDDAGGLGADFDDFDEFDDEEDSDEEDSDEEDSDEAKSMAAAAAVAAAEVAEGDRGTISLSGLPRSHWETLFNLDLVRARNRPKAAPTADPQAPFFLPTLRGNDGLTPTFTSGDAATATPLASFDGAAALEAKKKEQEAANDDGEDEDGDGAIMQSSGWDAAWSDDEEEEEEEEEEGKSGKKDGGNDEDEDARVVGYFSGGGNDGSSRLLRRTDPLAMPRCRLAEMLLNNNDSDDDDDDEDDDDDDGDEGGRPQDDEIVAFLKSLNPSAIDVELSGLSREADVADGTDHEVLVAALRWFTRCLGTCRDFEVVQAYLQRFLRLHAEVIALASSPPSGEDTDGSDSGGAFDYGNGVGSDDSDRARLGNAVRRAAAVQAKSARKLRELLQQNLCLIQFFSNTQIF